LRVPPKKKAEPKKLTLAETLTQLRTGKDKEPIGVLEEFKPVEGLTTGNLLLDAVTGVGGLPKGRITELIGPPSSGKTTCALQTAAKLQQAGGYVMFVDYEYALDKDYAQALGIDTKDPSFIYLWPKNFEHGANLFRKLLDTGELGMGIFDSVASMVTKREIESDTGTAEVMERAKLMHQFCRQIVGKLQQTDCAAVFLNHVMDKADLTPMGQRMAAQGIKQKTSPGGKALPFYGSLRMEFQQIGNVKEKGENELTEQEENLTTSVRTKVTVLKNKVGDPFRTAELRVRFGKGFSQPHAVLSYLVAQGIVKASAGVYKYPNELAPPFDVPKGESKQLEALEYRTDWLKTLEAKAVEVLAQKGMEKVDGSKYDKFGVEIAGDVTELSVAESQELDDEEQDVSDFLDVPEGGNKVNMKTGELM
jgi:recombination protein RecA